MADQTDKPAVITKGDQLPEQRSYFNMNAWRAMREMANTFIQSQALPAHIRNAAQLMVVFQTGRELGMLPMESVNSLYLVNGRLALQGVAMLRKMHSAGVKIKWESESDSGAKVTLSGLDRSPYTTEFTAEDARKAGLIPAAPGSPWTKYPKNMFRWRALSNAARLFCPDVIQNLYLVEELSDNVVMTVDGQFETAPEQPKKPVSPATPPAQPKPVEPVTDQQKVEKLKLEIKRLADKIQPDLQNTQDYIDFIQSSTGLRPDNNVLENLTEIVNRLMIIAQEKGL